METHFKGWAKPGIVPPGAYATPEVAADETLDALGGYFRIFQLRDGYRFSTDDVLTAWYGTTWAPSASRVLDLGSGIGSVGMIAAWRMPGARFVTIEAQEESVRLARKSAVYNGLADRYEIRHSDFRRADALGPAEMFDLILGTPPYFPVGSGIEGDHPQKVACRFELRGDIKDYVDVAARHLAAGGIFACIFPGDPLDSARGKPLDSARGKPLDSARGKPLDSARGKPLDSARGKPLDRVERAAAEADVTIIRRRPVIFREGEPPLVDLFAMMRSTDLPPHMRGRTWTEPPLVIRCADGGVHPEYAAVKLAVGFPP
jgi:tRNA1(Val) A37 N6-methylase TrmN6